CSAVAAPIPLFSALLNYRHTASAKANRPTTQGMKCLAKQGRTNYPLTLSIDDLGDEFELIAQASSPIDPHRVCAFMRTALERLANALEYAPETPVRDLDVLPEPERHQLLVEWNDTAVDYPRDRCIHELFEAQVGQSPEAVALVYEAEQLSYRELNARANRLAHHLRSLGVGPEVLVGVCLERSVELVVALLAILKAGGAYVPLDPGYPAERLAFMLEDTQAPVLVTHSALLAKLPPYTGHSVCVDRDSASIARHPETNPPASCSPTNLAYVIYTSGSTGKPKGVMIEHRSAVNYLSWIGGEFPLSDADRVVHKTPVGFDASVEEIFYPLSVGAVLVIAGSEAHWSAEELIGTISRAEITVLQVTPGLLASLLDTEGFRQCKSLRFLLCGAEALSADLADRFHDQSAAELINLYGPTETTISSTFMRVRAGMSKSRVPIGRPIANTKVVVVDNAGRLAPAGIAGELCISGEGVARGYLKRPDLTAERFVDVPYWDGESDRLYRTGDRVRLGADGSLEFLGRGDLQLKIRGFRIEPGEVEAMLSEHPDVNEAAVVARETPAGGMQLVAYFLHSRNEGCDANVLRDFLATRLPAQMLPAVFVELESFPRLPSGKLDRARLPAPSFQDAMANSEFAAPRNALERMIAQVWESVLHVDRVGVEQDFFEIGGHSLLAAQVVSRIRDAEGVPLGVRDLFTHPTVAALARSVEALKSAPTEHAEAGLVAVDRQAYRSQRKP
ncbi:MAG: non-ribosomal peptide synthetase, partial [Bacteroidota bacterium]